MSEWLLLQKLHGHLGVLALAASLHPVLSVRARLSAYAAAALMVATHALGWWVYPAYRSEVKLRVYEASYAAGQLFETKEHLAFFALCLALAGVGLTWARQPSRTIWGLCAACALGAGVIGVVVSSVAGFAYPAAG